MGRQHKFGVWSPRVDIFMSVVMRKAWQEMSIGCCIPLSKSRYESVSLSLSSCEIFNLELNISTFSGPLFLFFLNCRTTVSWSIHFLALLTKSLLQLWCSQSLSHFLDFCDKSSTKFSYIWTIWYSKLNYNPLFGLWAILFFFFLKGCYGQSMEPNYKTLKQVL